MINPLTDFCMVYLLLPLNFFLIHLVPRAPFPRPPPPPENIRKPYDFLMFSGGRERVHWERMRYFL